jgi:Phenol hydroxylase, C-terminal dimerisation domain
MVGLGVKYPENKLNWKSKTSEMKGCRLVAGERLDAGWITRFINGEPVRVIHEIQFNSPGGFRLYVLTGSLSQNASKLHALAKGLLSPTSFMNRYRGKLRTGLEGLPTLSPEASQKSAFNPFFVLLLIVKQNRFRFELADLDHLSPLNRYVYADDHQPGGDKIGDLEGDDTIGGLHRKWGLEDGGIVVARPDGYVGLVVSLSEFLTLDEYFAGFLKETAMGARL